MQNCVGEVLLLGIFAVTAYRDWKEQMICVYVPLVAGIAGLVLHLMFPTQKLTDLLLGAGIGAAFACGVGQQGGDRLRGWRNADGKRYFPGILAECGAAFYVTRADCSGSIVWTHCEAQKKRLPYAIYPVSFCGVCISVGMAVETKRNGDFYERMERKSDHRGGDYCAARAGVVCIHHEKRYSDVYRVQGHCVGDRAGARNRDGKNVLPLAGSGGIISK